MTNRDRLIECAADLFSRHGFAPVGLDRIIAEVGVTKTTFYNHFASKDDLVIAVLDRRHEEEIAELIQNMRNRAGEDPRQQILAMFDLFDEWFNTPDFRGCMFLHAANEYPLPNDPVHLAAVKHGEELHAIVKSRCITAGADDKTANMIAGQIVVVITGAVVSRHVAKEADAAKIARLTASIVLDRFLPSRN